MKTSIREIGAEKNEFILILIHLGLGVAVFFFHFLSTAISLLIAFYALYQIIKNRDVKHQALLYGAYIAGAEVLFRMSKGLLLYEFCKYLVILFFLVGILHRQIAKSSIIYILYLILLVPGIFISIMGIEAGLEVRKAIAFNLAGPVCLGLAAIYCYNRKIDYVFVNRLLFYFLLPIISVTVYLFLYTPDLQDVITNTESNSYTSGGYGPNQVSTILGFGMFVCLVRFFLFSHTIFWKMVNALLFVIIAYRGLLTFSRGGFLTALIMIAVFVFFLYIFSHGQRRARIMVIGMFGLIMIAGVWTYTVIVSKGLIENRYTNKNRLGKEEEDFSSGRLEILNAELDAFYKNPIFGIGVGNNKSYRMSTTGIDAPSHNEITRILSEHGFLGIVAFMIVCCTPVFRYLAVHRNVLIFSFFLFWFLTINHSAMRIAAPAFVYGLTLLTITSEKNIVHRK